MDTPSPSPSKTSSLTLAAYLQEQTAARLRRLAYEMRNSRQSMDEDRVHDLRVATRRLMETLRVILRSYRLRRAILTPTFGAPPS